MRPGVVGYGEPLEALLTAASRAGMSHLEIDLNDERNGLESLTPQRCTDVARVAESLALTLSLHAPYTLNLCDKVPALRRASVAFLRDCLGVADAFHATHITVHPGYYNGPQAHGPVRDEARARLVESVRQAAEPRRDRDQGVAKRMAPDSTPRSAALRQYGTDVVAANLVQERILHKNCKDGEVSDDVAENRQEHVHEAISQLFTEGHGGEIIGLESAQGKDIP